MNVCACFVYNAANNKKLSLNAHWQYEMVICYQYSIHIAFLLCWWICISINFSSVMIIWAMIFLPEIILFQKKLGLSCFLGWWKYKKAIRARSEHACIMRVEILYSCAVYLIIFHMQSVTIINNNNNNWPTILKFYPHFFP